MTVDRIIENFITKLKGFYSLKESRSLAYLAIESKMGLNRHQIFIQNDREVESYTESELLKVLEELETGRPIQYILSETEFCGLKFSVDENVLIPRPETEELIYWIKENIAEYSRILDIGTGSGCIAVALKHFLPKAEVFALDVSEKALEVARKNAIINNSEIYFVQKNILNDRLIDLPQFDVIVSNPPYVTVSEQNTMHRNILNFEPYSALFVPDDKPLLFYNCIAEVSREKLINGGSLYFEINEQFGDEVKKMLLNFGFYQVNVKRDLHGKERMVKALNRK